MISSTDLGSGVRPMGDGFIHDITLSEPCVDLLLWRGWFTDKERHRSPKQKQLVWDLSWKSGRKTNVCCSWSFSLADSSQSSVKARWRRGATASPLLVAHRHHMAEWMVHVDFKGLIHDLRLNYGSHHQHTQRRDWHGWGQRSSWLLYFHMHPAAVWKVLFVFVLACQTTWNVTVLF